MQIPIRIGRAVSASLLFATHEISAIAVSEVVSVLAPVLNPQFLERVLGAIVAMMYAPRFSHEIVSKLSYDTKKYQQAEICTMLLFFLTFTLYHI